MFYGDLDLSCDTGEERAPPALVAHAGGDPVGVRRGGPCLLASVARGACLRRPAVFGEGRYLLALDGRLTDRESLHAALGAGFGDGGGWGDGDAGLIGAALLRWGDDALLRLHGQFAIAWWDGVERRLLLACDRTGGRTLFFHRSAGDRRLRFSGAIGVLLADPDIPRRVDPQALVRSAFKMGFDVGGTNFAGIEQILAADKLVMTPDKTGKAGVRVERYWRLDPHRRIRFPRDGDYVDAARELLDRVVAQHLPRKGPIVAMMSGGLDSTAVAATAARLAAPDVVYTLTSRPDPAACPPNDNRLVDEWDLAQDIARLYPNMRSEAAFARFDSIDDAILRVASCIGRLPVHLFPALWFNPAWRRARALGATAVLAGISGNGTLSASGLSKIVRPATMADLPGALADGCAQLFYRPDPRTASSVLKGLLPPWAGAWLRRVAGRTPMWAQRTGLTAAAAEAGDYDGRRTAWIGGGADAPYRLRWRLRIIERTWDGVAVYSPMRHARGVDYLDPLGDVRLAEFCLALPLDQFIRGREDRFLARRVLADRLPQSVLNEKRRGRQNHEWFDWLTRLRPWLAAELDSLDNSSLGRELVDAPRLRASLDDWPDDAAAAEARYSELMHALGGGAMLSVFLRWAEGRNA